MLDPAVYIVIVLAGIVFFFITKLRLTQERVHQELKGKGEDVTEHPFPSGNMGSETGGAALGRVIDDVTDSETSARPSTSRTRSRKAD